MYSSQTQVLSIWNETLKPKIALDDIKLTLV